MSRRATYTLLAHQDLIDILDYISRDKPRAAAEHVSMIEEKCSFLANNPDIGQRRPEYPGDVRSFTAGNYVVYYRKTLDGIEVARIIHSARHVRSLD